MVLSNKTQNAINRRESAYENIGFDRDLFVEFEFAGG